MNAFDERYERLTPLQRQVLDRWVAEGNGPPDEVREKLERAFRALSPRPGPPPEELP